MPTHAERRVVPYTAEQMYHLVADIEKYPQFLPWCLGVRPSKRMENVIEAEMTIGFKSLRESFKTRVTLTESEAVKVEYLSGPFQYLNNEWHFETVGQSCAINFFIDFEFKSKILKMLIGPIFNEAVKIMVRAFEKRAAYLYTAK